jgi:hypothetical protein
VAATVLLDEVPFATLRGIAQALLAPWVANCGAELIRHLAAFVVAMGGELDPEGAIDDGGELLLVDVLLRAHEVAMKMVFIFAMRDFLRPGFLVSESLANSTELQRLHQRMLLGKIARAGADEETQGAGGTAAAAGADEEMQEIVEEAVAEEMEQAAEEMEMASAAGDLELSRIPSLQNKLREALGRWCFDADTNGGADARHHEHVVHDDLLALAAAGGSLDDAGIPDGSGVADPTYRILLAAHRAGCLDSR